MWNMFSYPGCAGDGIGGGSPTVSSVWEYRSFCILGLRGG